ncbi:MAG: SHD1 domain-containing protein [Planctomycetota bacterium]
MSVRSRLAPACAAVAIVACCFATESAARTWTDDSGAYTLDAELIAFDEERAILKRDADGELGIVEIERLSEADEAFVAEQRDAASANETDAPLWTLRSGLQTPGRVVEFTRREVTLRRKRGKVYVNDRVFGNLPAVYRKIVPQIVGEFTGNEVRDEASLERWLVHRKGEPQTFTVDGVVMEVANGDEYALPFFLFADRDEQVLRRGWEEWLEATGQSDSDRRAELSLALQARAAESRQNAAAQLQIAQLQLGMTAVDAGVTSLWEVTLYPGNGVAGSPVWVMAPGRDSRAATQAALQKYPGYRAGPVRRLSR